MHWSRSVTKAFKTVFGLVWTLLDGLILGRRPTARPQTLLIVKTDAIGDYMLFRNFLADIRDSERFRGWRISYLGWTACRDLAQTFDSGLVDEFIWLDRSAFMRRARFRWPFMRQLRQRGFEVVFNPCCCRELPVLDSLVRATGAVRRIGCTGDLSNRTWLDRWVGDRWYTELHAPPPAPFFEFELNRLMVQQLLGKRPGRLRPELVRPHPPGARSRTVLVFPGARHPRRRWPASRLAELIFRMRQVHGVRVVLCGGPGDREMAAEICAHLPGAVPENLVGGTNFRQLVDLIAGCGLVVSGDSGPVHLAAALDAPLVCLSTANQVFRFTPYPDGMLSHASFVFPPQVARRLQQPESLWAQYSEYSSIRADEIPLDAVWAAVDRLLAP